MLSSAAFAQRAAVPLAFEVATIKPSQRTDGSWRLQPTPDGYTGMDISLLHLVKEAYGISDPKLVVGGPNWIDKDKFDLEAKFDAAVITKAKKLTYHEYGDMLRLLLAERFKLKVHHETRTFPVFNLVIAKGGLKLQVSGPKTLHDYGMGSSCLHALSGNEGCTVGDLAHDLTFDTGYGIGRTVIDKTGLTGRYDFNLHWTSDLNPARDSDAPSIFTAVEEQLGLKLEPSTAPLDVLVIDSAEKPSAN